MTLVLIGGTGLWRAVAGSDSRQISFVSRHIQTSPGLSLVNPLIINWHQYKTLISKIELEEKITKLDAHYDSHFRKIMLQFFFGERLKKASEKNILVA